MSRSYNKQGLWKDHYRAGSAKGWKKLANRKFRRTFSLDSTRDRQYYRKSVWFNRRRVGFHNNYDINIVLVMN